MTDTTKDVKFLRGLMPNAVITVELTDPPSYECDLRHAQITDKESDALFPPIRDYFGHRLSERYSMSTSHFKIYLKRLADHGDIAYGGGITLAKSHEIGKKK